MNFSMQISKNLLPNLIKQGFELQNFQRKERKKNFAGHFDKFGYRVGDKKGRCYFIIQRFDLVQIFQNKQKISFLVRCNLAVSLKL